MSEDFYPFVDSGDPAPDNMHLTGEQNTPVICENNEAATHTADAGRPAYSTRISVYDDMFSTPRVIVVEQSDVRTYLEDVTNTVHRTMKEQGGHLSLMIIRELVENFIHAQFSEPVISILDNGDTIRFADQGPGIHDKERAFEFGVTSADRSKKRYIRGTGAGLPMVQQYVEASGGAISVEDNLGAGTVVTVSVNPQRVAELERAVSRGAAVRGGRHEDQAGSSAEAAGAPSGYNDRPGARGAWDSMPGACNPLDPHTNPSMQHAGTIQQAGFSSMQHGAGMPTPMAYGAPQTSSAPQYAMPDPQPMESVTQASEEAYVNAAAPQQMGGAMPGQQMYGAPQGQNMAAMQGQPYYQQAHPWMNMGMGAYPTYANPYAIPQPCGAMPGGYPVPGVPQPCSPATAMQGMGAPQPAAAEQAAMTTAPYVSERGSLALRFIAQNGKGGPTDLTRAFGNSDATWSRELDTLAGTGLIYKRSQKYVLTELGQRWTQRQ